MAYQTIDPEIEFGVRVTLSNRGQKELFKSVSLVAAYQYMEMLRKPQRGVVSNSEWQNRLYFDYWLRCSIKNQVQFLADQIVKDHLKRVENQ